MAVIILKAAMKLLREDPSHILSLMGFFENPRKVSKVDRLEETGVQRMEQRT